LELTHKTFTISRFESMNPVKDEVCCIVTALSEKNMENCDQR
jgi:hypothetical protein